MSKPEPTSQDYDIAMNTVEQMGLGYEFRNCSCGELPCARLRPIASALARREAEVLKTFDALREVARFILSKSDIRSRWPCADCGRVDANAPLRTIEYKQEDGTQVITGCWLCNTEDVRDAARAALALATVNVTANKRDNNGS